MTTSLTATILLLALFGMAQSQPPAPASRPQSKDQQRQSDTHPDPTSAPNETPATTTAAVGVGTDTKGNPNSSNPKDASTHDWWSIVPSLVQALAALASTGVTIAIYYIYTGQLRVMKHQAVVMRLSLTANRRTIEKMDEIAKDQSADLEKSIKESARAATAMEASTEIARDTATAAKDTSTALGATLATNREIERAYIAVSLRQDKTIWYDCTDLGSDRTPQSTDPNADSLELLLEFRNHGRTPGEVVGGFATFVYDTPDENGKPDTGHATGGDHLTPLFLLPDEKPIDFATGIHLGQEAVKKLRRHVELDGSKILWFVAEVHYRDRFGGFHKGGYGRRWNPRGKVFQIDPSTEDLNFDAPMTEAEIARARQAKAAQ